MMNLQIMQGRLTHDPEIRYVGAEQTPVVHFSVACDRDYGKGEEKETDFFDVVAWRQTAEFIYNYFTKGRMILFYGRLQVRKWKDKETGEPRKAVEIKAEHAYFGDSKKADGETAGPGAPAAPGAPSAARAPAAPAAPGMPGGMPMPGGFVPDFTDGDGASELEQGGGELPF